MGGLLLAVLLIPLGIFYIYVFHMSPDKAAFAAFGTGFAGLMILAGLSGGAKR